MNRLPWEPAGRVDADCAELCCPLCGDPNTHIDRVAMAARPDGEDGPIREVGVRCDGDVVRGVSGDLPPSRHVGVGRRHRIALVGWCELCNGEFALLFTQHKGVTLVESIDLARGHRVLSDFPPTV